jgi:hypothetical protein
MIKKVEILAILILVFCEMTKATTVNISTVTDKESYLLGEEVVVSVTAYNPDPNPVTLYFVSSLEASYLMDDVYDWTEGKFFSQFGGQLTIDPYSSYTWELTHGPGEMGLYPLDVGTHTVVGEVVGYGESAPVQFGVIPEPATILLLTLGSLLLTRRRQ